MGNTQTVGRKHHHKSHHTYTKKQGRHTKVRHTKGNRRYRYYQRGGEPTEPAPAPAAPAPAAPAAAAAAPAAPAASAAPAG